LARAAEDGVDTGNQLAHAERLGQIVVGADFETDDAIDFFAARSEHDHGDIGLAAQAPENFESIDVGQVDIQQDRGGPVTSTLFDALLAELRRAEVESFLREGPAQQLHHFAIVIDDQDSPHNTSIG